MPQENREFKVWLPLYDGITNIEIGIDSLASIEKPAFSTKLPIVFYGTSITQGGCASRPGMAYPSIISRKMDVDCINLGFSGNGKMEEAVVDVIGGIKASFYVIDCLPNMSVAEVKERVSTLAQSLRSRNTNTPIVFVENIEYSKIFYEEATRKLIQDKNEALKTEFEKLKKAGMKNLYFISAKNAIGADNEATVDGVHLTDLGFMRMADHLIKEFLKNNIQIKTE
jgi:lysophospholipase L1-like esterase